MMNHVLQYEYMCLIKTITTGFYQETQEIMFLDTRIKASDRSGSHIFFLFLHENYYENTPIQIY